MDTAIDGVKADLVPLLGELVRLTGENGEEAQTRFFRRILASLARCQDFEDLAGPFMELSQSAFLGFHFTPDVSLLIDQVLERAQIVAQTLSASGDEVQ